MNHAQNSRLAPRGRRPQTVSKQTLNIPINTALDDLLQTTQTGTICPDPLRTRISGHINALDQATQNLQIATIGETITEFTHILSTVTGFSTEALGQFHSVSAQRENLHQIRNTLAAALALAALNNADDPAWIHEQIPHLKSRGSKGRALHDDEILLARINTEYVLANGGRSLYNAVKYLLCDAGLRPSESVAVTTTDLDDVSKPTMIHAPGVKGRATERDIPLGPWHQQALQKALQQIHDNQPLGHATLLAYRPEGTGNKYGPSAAASSAIARHLQISGLTDPSLEPHSIVRWAVQSVLDQTRSQDRYATQARKFSGIAKVSALFEFLDLNHDQYKPAPTTGGYLSNAAPQPRHLKVVNAA